MPKLLVLPGDGIGPEVVREARKILDYVAKRGGLAVDITEGKIGGASLDVTGDPITVQTLQQAAAVDAVLMGAVGGPKWDILPPDKRPERGLLAIRKGMGVFANLRPVKVFAPLIAASSLKKEYVKGIDLVVVRELTGGIYFGTPKGIETLGENLERGFNTELYTTPEVERVARVAFDLAMKRRRKVTSVDKANVLESSMLWRKVVTRIAAHYPDVTVEHMYVDNCAMQLVRNPRQFDVILTTNLFGDILSDEAAMLTGSIGMLPSASLGQTGTASQAASDGSRRGLYEPVHGSAPDITGQDMANPLATILSVAMILEYSLGRADLARRVEQGVERVLEKGYRTPDIVSPGCKRVGTRRMGDLVLQELKRSKGT